MNEKRLLWEKRINKRIQSKMPVREWCEKNGLSRHQYNYWNRQIQKNQKPDEEVIFADITPTLAETKNIKKKIASPYNFQVSLNNIQVTIPDNFDPEVLTGLMKVLKAL